MFCNIQYQTRRCSLMQKDIYNIYIQVTMLGRYYHVFYVHSHTTHQLVPLAKYFSINQYNQRRDSHFMTSCDLEFELSTYHLTVCII